jgi:hypothetical protein
VSVTVAADLAVLGCWLGVPCVSQEMPKVCVRDNRL